jgi:uncharacterized protein (DUF1778 family)
VEVTFDHVQVARVGLRQARIVVEPYGACVYASGMATTKQRWDFRVDPDTDRLVRQAAESSQRSLTDFVVDSALHEAERLIAERTQFVLDDERWDSFVALLDRPPRDNPGLHKLFAKPSVFITE